VKPGGLRTQEAFLKAMDLLETELHNQDTPRGD
jgi:hypothetical protein